MSPSLLEQYLSASRKVSSLAVGDPATSPISHVYPVPPDLSQDDHIEGLPLGTRGGLLIRHNFPLDAEYQFSVKLLRNIVGYMTGLEWPHQLEIIVDGERVFLAPVGGPGRQQDVGREHVGGRRQDRRASESPRAGSRPALAAIGVTFIRKTSAESDEPLQPHTRDHDLQNMNGIPQIDYVDITGTVRSDRPGRYAEPPPDFHLPARERRARRAPCARKILSTLARRAYRRPVSDAEVEALDGFYQDGRKKAGFEAGIQNALRLILASPKFLFRAEPDPPNAAPGTVYKLGDLELASRLSFFLWSSIPDDELLDRRGTGKAEGSRGSRSAGARMLADPRAEALVEELRGPVAVPPQSAEPSARQQRHFRISTTTCGRRSGARPSCCSTASCARTAACSIC